VNARPVFPRASIRSFPAFSAEAGFPAGATGFGVIGDNEEDGCLVGCV